VASTQLSTTFSRRAALTQSGEPPTGRGRLRLAAWAIDFALLALVIVVAARFFADLTGEAVPAPLRDNGIDACALLESQLGASVSDCLRIGDFIIYSTRAESFRIAVGLPLFAVVVGIVIRWQMGATLGQLVVATFGSRWRQHRAPTPTSTG
jgi:hypothetical protein